MATTKSRTFTGGAIAGDPTPIPVPADALFIVSYDETPAGDIGDALHDKKVPCLFYNGEVVELFHASANNYVFRSTHIRNVNGENILDIVDYIVVGSTWSTRTKEISNGYESQAYLKKVSSPATFDTTGESGMKTLASVSGVPNDGVYQVSVMLSVTPKTANATKSDLVFGFYGADGIGMADHTFHAVVDDSQTFAQQLSFSTTLNLKAGVNSLKLSCDSLNTNYLVFVDDLTVAQLVNGVYHNGDKFEAVNDLTEAANFNADDELLVVSPNSTRKMLWTTLANKVLGFIKSLSTTITAFRTGDVIPVDGPSGTAKMSKDDLLRVTAENAVEKINNTLIESDFVTGHRIDQNGNYVVDPSNYYGTQIVNLNGLNSVRLKKYWKSETRPSIAFYNSDSFEPITFYVNPVTDEFIAPEGATRFIVQRPINSYTTEEIWVYDSVAKKSDLKNKWITNSFSVDNYYIPTSQYILEPSDNRLTTPRAIYVGKGNEFKLDVSDGFLVLINYFSEGYVGETRTSVVSYGEITSSYIAKDDFVVLTFKKSDDSDISSIPKTNISIYGYDDVEYSLKEKDLGRRAKVITIAACDSPDKEKLSADIVCDGKNDEVEINSAVVSSYGYNTKIKFLAGTYNIDSFITRNDGATPCVVRLPSDRQNCVELCCEENFAMRKASSYDIVGGAVFVVTSSCYENLDENQQYAIIRSGAINGEIPKIGGIANVSRLVVKGISFRLPDNQKKIICIDGYFSASMEIDYCIASARYSTSLFHTPVDGCIGIRGLQGSTYGFGNKWTRCMMFGFREGFAVAGEHLLLEDCAALYCWYGYTFNNFTKNSGWWGHPIILINCCDENNYNFPYFNTQPNNIYDARQCVNFVSFNMEIISNPDPEHEREFATEETPGQWYGTIDYTIQDNTGRNLVGQKFWADGCGIGFKSHNGAQKEVISASERKSYAPNYGQVVYDTTLVKPLICTNPATKLWRDMNGDAIVDL